jgi:hypothetical protein
MNRELKFDLSVETNALLCPNPTEFYSKAYITADVADNYRTLPGVKSSTKLANTLFTSVLKASSCDFGTTTESLDAVDIDVCAVSALGELCRFDLEQSFLSLQMVKGSNGSFEVASFMSYYWDEMSKEIESEIEQIRWIGNTSNGAFSGATAFLKLCDGYEKKIAAASASVINVTAITISSANVIAEMTKVVSALPVVLSAKRGDLRFYVASDVAIAYEIAAAQGNTQAYITQTLGLSFIGIKVVVAEGMTAGKMILTRKDNLVYAFDAEGDSKALKAINLEDTVAEPKLRTRANLKIGFEILNAGEIVSYGI